MTRTVLEVGSRTDVGMVRTRNEDSFGNVPPIDEKLFDARGHLFIVADGMGGHAAGNVASKLAVELVTKAYYEEATDDDPAKNLEYAVKVANRAIHEEAQRNPEYFRMGTTFVGIVIIARVVYVANVGDSRCYRVRGDSIEQLTRDHSWVALQVEMGEMTQEEAETSQNRSILLSCLGEKPDVLVDTHAHIVEVGDAFILCSDGLHGLVPKEEIAMRVNGMNAQAACESLVEMANSRGGHDNITVQIVRVKEIDPDAPTPVLVETSRPARSIAASRPGGSPGASPIPGSAPSAGASSGPAQATAPASAPPVLPPGNSGGAVPLAETVTAASPIPPPAAPFAPPEPPLPNLEQPPQSAGLITGSTVTFFIIGVLVSLLVLLGFVLRKPEETPPPAPPGQTSPPPPSPQMSTGASSAITPSPVVEPSVTPEVVSSGSPSAEGGALPTHEIPTGDMPVPSPVPTVQSGGLDVRTSPANGVVFIDGRKQGPAPVHLVVEPGPHRIEVRWAKGRAWKGEVVVKPEETTPVTVKQPRK